MIRSGLLVTGLLIGLLCALAAGWAAGGTKAGRPGRIVSLNLCADQYLLALADRDQLAALTANARDPDMSAAASAARGIPLVRGTAEEVLALRPDLILTMTDATGQALSALTHRPYRSLAVPPANDYRQIVAQIRMVASAVGHPSRGEALIRRMDADLAAIPRLSRPVVAAYYQRRGYLTGAGTLVDDLMRRVGLVNLASQTGRSVLSYVSLEQMVAAHPDYLIVESATDRVEDQGSEMLQHPALSRLPRLRLSEAWTVCGGPAYVRAARSLADQLARAQ